MKYCRYHDLFSCGKEDHDCLGGQFCDPQPSPTPELAFCAVCAGVIKPKSRR